MKAMAAREDIMFVYVPRAPERFDETADALDKAGFHCIRRSKVLDQNLDLLDVPEKVDVLIGDSLGEMYFYLSMCDRVLVGGGFTSKGSHNISEPLALGKPVIVGPELWTIEFPVIEAIEAGVCVQSNAQTLTDDLAKVPAASAADITRTA